MKEKRDNIKTIKIEHKEGEKGSITVFVLTSLLFMTLFVMLVYSNIINKKTATRKNIDKIKEEYGNSERIQQEMEDEYYGINEIEFGPGVIVKGKNEVYTNNGTAIIPVGFAIVPGCEDVSKGLVISDNVKDTELDKNNIVAEGNQFVWIPVPDYSLFKLNYDAETHRGEINGAGETTNNNVRESDKTVEEAKKMYSSVKINKGFYIGRYEASESNTGKTEIKKGKIVKTGGWINYPEPNSGCGSYGSGCGSYGSGCGSESGTKIYDGTAVPTYIDSNGVVELAREMYGNSKEKYGVTSTLCYSVQWDAALNFIEKNHPGYSKNSSGKGNYNENENINSWRGSKTESGKIDDYKVNNIYDMAGNVEEWTMEYYYNEYIDRIGNTHIDYNRVCRGGSYEFNGNDPNSAERNNPNNPNNEDKGFRVTLFL